MVLRADDMLSMSGLRLSLYLGMAAYCVIYAGINIWWFNLILAMLILNELLTMICFARKITLSEKGVEIQLWKFHKFYTWNEMWYRQYRRYDGLRDVYPGGFWFNTKHIDHSPLLPEFLRGRSYFQMRYYPFTCFCVHFKPRKQQMHKGHAPVFEVDRNTFLLFVKRNNIRIEGLESL